TIKEFFPDTKFIATSPTIKQNEWRVAVSTTDRYYVGTVVHGHIQLYDEFERVPVPNIKLMDKAKQDKNISAFLSFSPIYLWEITEYEKYDEVRFNYLRYRNDMYFPLVAVVHIDNDMNILSSYTRCTFSQHKLQNKLALAHIPT